jgi:tRNA(fMet)-specific endonuclease VapC
MSGVVVDTNILSFAFRSDTRFGMYRRHHVGREWHISFMTLAEINAGIFLRGWTFEASEKLDQQLSACRILFADTELCSEWGRIRALRRPRPIPVADCWIAATALRLNCPLVTHNPKDFVDIQGLQVITEAAS